MNLYRSILILAVSGFLFACGQAPNSNTTQSSNAAPTATAPSTAPTADLMAQGRKLYSENCAGCHKEDGTGGKITIEGRSINPDDLTSAKIKGFTDEKIYGYIHNGIEDEGMPAFKDDLSEAEIREVVRYVRAGLQKMPQTEPTKRAGGVD